MNIRTRFRDGHVVLPDGIERTDLICADGEIQHIGVPAGAQWDEEVDCGGLHVLPGLIDDQVHFREPGLTHKEDLRHGSRAAAKGGVTTFLEMPNTNPTTTTVERLHEKIARAAEVCAVDFGFYIGATPDNVDELKRAERTPGIKIFIGSSTGNLLVDQQEALERIFAETTIPICAHCEDEQTVRDNAERLGGGKTVHDHSRIRNVEAAVIATKRAIDLAVRHSHPFHVLHVSTGAECDIIEDAPRDLITAEACPHHLLFSIDDYDRLGSLVQMNPSVKTVADQERIWKALHSGTIEVIATDHAPHTLEEKQQDYPKSPSGLPAVENSLALMLDQHHRGRCTLEEIVRWMAEAPARIWNIDRKGKIAEGYAADLVLVDRDAKHVIRNEEQIAKSGWSPWHGVELTGLPVETWLRGQRVFSRGTFDDTVRGREATFRRT